MINKSRALLCQDVILASIEMTSIASRDQRVTINLQDQVEPHQVPRTQILENFNISGSGQSVTRILARATGSNSTCDQSSGNDAVRQSDFRLD